MDQEQKRKASPLVLVLVIIIVVLVAAGAVLLLGKFGEQEPEADTLGDNQTPPIGYEEGVTVVDDPDALQKAVDAMQEKAKQEGIPLEYQNGASSKDGTKFDCYIANPAKASYDFFINIYADAELTDQLYLSGLIPPGSAKRELELDHALSPGTHRVFVVFTQVEDDHTTIHQQATVTMDFSVFE